MKASKQQLQKKLNSLACIIRKYNLFDKVSFEIKYNFIETTIIEKAWIYGLKQIKNGEIVKDATILTDEERQTAQTAQSTFSNEPNSIYYYLNKQFYPKDLKLSDENIERHKRNLLAKRYIELVHKELEVLALDLKPTFENRTKWFLNKFKIALIIFGIISIFSIPRIIDGLTPVDVLAFKIYEKSKRTFNGAVCNDGHISHSQGRGTCSWHSGVDYYFYKGEYSKTIEECREEARKISWLD